MKFNDKELGAWATVFAPDKEGLLEKKGAGRGQGEWVTESDRPSGTLCRAVLFPSAVP